MTFYPGYSIDGHNTRHLSGLTLEECAAICMATDEFLCKTLDYHEKFGIIRANCYLSKETYYRVSAKERERVGNWVMGTRD